MLFARMFSLLDAITSQNSYRYYCFCDVRYICCNLNPLLMMSGFARVQKAKNTRLDERRCMFGTIQKDWKLNWVKWRRLCELWRDSKKKSCKIYIKKNQATSYENVCGLNYWTRFWVIHVHYRHRNVCVTSWFSFSFWIHWKK